MISKQKEASIPRMTDHRSLNADLRGWEWRYLWKECRSDAQFALCEKSNMITSLAASHDGKWIAVGDANGGLSIWDPRARREIARLPAGEPSWVRAAFSPTGLLLAFSTTTSATPTNRQSAVRLWDGANQKFGAELPLGGPCVGLVFSEDGQTLATATAHPDNQVALWRIPEGKKLAAYSAPQDPDVGNRLVGTPFAAARDLSVAAHGMPGGRIRVIDLATGKERWSALATDEKVAALALPGALDPIASRFSPLTGGAA